MTVTGIEKNSVGNDEVHTVVLVHQNGDVLFGASPEGDVAFHIVGTVLQQASQGRCVYKISPIAECAAVAAWATGVLAISVVFLDCKRRR